MSNLPDLMRKFASIAREEPFHSRSAGGEAFHLAFTHFLDANAEADAQDVLTDFIAITARNILAIHVIQHDGDLCVSCLEDLANLVADQLSDDANELAENLDGMAGRKH